jgi:hypothetical protein
VPGAFPAIVDKATFDRVQAMLPRNADRQWTDKELLRKLKRLLAAKGRLSESIILKARGMPAIDTLHRHFGPYKQMYALIDYHPPVEDIFRTAQTERSMVLRRELIDRIKTLFPKNVTVFHFPNRTRSVLRLDNDFNVSVVLCRTRPRPAGGLHWTAEPTPIERGFITLLCTLSPKRDQVQRFYVFEAMKFKTRRFLDNDPWLRTAIRLKSLSELYAAVKTIHEAQCKLVLPAESEI